MENENIKFLNNLDAGSSGLLGEFSTSNTYVVADDIKQDLLKANKLITDYSPEKITATATAGSYTFEFVIYVQLGEQGKKRATLFLIEKAKLGIEEKELLTLIKPVIIEAGQNVIIVIKKEFNLFVRDESDGIDLSNGNLTTLINRKAQVSSRSKYLANALYDADHAYVMKMLGIIKSTGPYGDRFLTQFKNMLRARKLTKDDPTYWHTVKRLLDRMVADNALLFSGKTKARIEEMQKAYRDLVAGTKEPAKDTVQQDKKKSKKPSKPKKIKAFEGVKIVYPSVNFAPGGGGGKPDKAPFRAFTPPGSRASKISSNKNTNHVVFGQIMKPIYVSNITKDHMDERENSNNQNVKQDNGMERT